MQKFHKLYAVQILCTFDFISPECTAKSLFIHALMELLALNKMTTKVHRLQTESFVKIVPRNYLVIFKLRIQTLLLVLVSVDINVYI